MLRAAAEAFAAAVSSVLYTVDSACWRDEVILMTAGPGDVVADPVAFEAQVLDEEVDAAAPGEISILKTLSSTSSQYLLSRY